jgi:hypothetical protein
MVGNDADKDTCACCSAPKPGGATPKPAPTAAPATTVVTPNKKSDDYLAHLKVIKLKTRPKILPVLTLLKAFSNQMAPNPIIFMDRLLT